MRAIGEKPQTAVPAPEGAEAQTAAPRGSGFAAVVALWVVVGLLSWAFYLWVFHRTPAQDWMVFYTAARAFLDGDLGLIFHGARFTAALNHRFAGWLRVPLDLHPWVYPPSYLFLFLPFGLLPRVFSFLLFEAAGFVACLVAASFRFAKGRGRVLLWLSLLFCPAVPFDVLTGQNAFYTSALLLGGFAMLERYPLFAGALLGILTFKPQLWLMAPVALVSARKWRAVLGMLASALALALAGLALFGLHAWTAWFDLASGNGALYRGWLRFGRLNGVSVFACATLLGAPSAVANLAQAAALLIAGGFVFWAFRRPARAELRLSILFAATMLAAPHASASDAVMLGLAAALFLSQLPQSPLRPVYATASVVVWISPLFNPPTVFEIGLLTPLFILLFLFCAAGAMRHRKPPGAMAAGAAGG